MSSVNKEARARARVAGDDSREMRRGQIVEEALVRKLVLILNVMRSYRKVFKQKMSSSD